MKYSKSTLRECQNNKAPGPDLIVPFWIKKLTSLHSHIQSLPRGGGGGVTRVSEWTRMPPPPAVMGLQSLSSPGIGLGFHSK